MKPPTNTLLRITTSYLVIIAGAAIYAVGFSFFSYPNAIPTGGLVGIAMILNFLWDKLPVGTMTIVMNIPLFLFAWKKFGLEFMLASLVGMVVSSLLVDLFNTFGWVATSQPLLASIYGGLLKGIGLGLVYKVGGTTGGVDIVAKFLRKRRPHINFGTFILILDVVVIGTFAAVFRLYDSAMYGIITMFVGTQIIDLVLYGAINTKTCHIITDKSAEISVAITQKLVRGVTLLRGEGGWSHREKGVILCAIKPQQITELRRLVSGIDEEAFVIVSDAREVFGKGFMSIESEL
ncbi:MAG: YitT family protein [Firmicutes bacterium]|nr:YitT family protein [Bacillota bacterium]